MEGLAREARLDEGYGRANTDDMRDDGDDRVEPGKLSGRARGERHDDPVHEKVNENAVDWAVDEWLANHEGELAAGDIENRGGAEGD